jgi:hypothetical protein
MKQFILSLAASLIIVVANAQASIITKTTNYEAANWKTWLLDSRQQITVATPPTAAQSQSELKAVKQRVNSLDEKKLKAIRFWDAVHHLIAGTKL